MPFNFQVVRFEISFMSVTWNIAWNGSGTEWNTNTHTYVLVCPQWWVVLPQLLSWQLRAFMLKDQVKMSPQHTVQSSHNQTRSQNITAFEISSARVISWLRFLKNIKNTILYFENEFFEYTLPFKIWVNNYFFWVFFFFFFSFQNWVFQLNFVITFEWFNYMLIIKRTI